MSKSRDVGKNTDIVQTLKIHQYCINLQFKNRKIIYLFCLKTEIKILLLVVVAIRPMGIGPKALAAFVTFRKLILLFFFLILTGDFFNFDAFLTIVQF